MQDVQIDAIDDEIRKDDEEVPELGSKTMSAMPRKSEMLDLDSILLDRPLDDRRKTEV